MANKTVDDLVKEYTSQTDAMRRMFQTSDGQQTMAFLEELFCDRSSIVQGDPYQTHANEGAREVILTMKEIIKNAD